MTPINDSCERALALTTSYNGTLTRDEESYQHMMLVVEHHRKKYGLFKKSDLKRVL